MGWIIAALFLSLIKNMTNLLELLSIEWVPFFFLQNKVLTYFTYEILITDTFWVNNIKVWQWLCSLFQFLKIVLYS